MPALILLDNSLSMLMSATGIGVKRNQHQIASGSNESLQGVGHNSGRRFELALTCAQQIVDYMRDCHKSDAVALATFNHEVNVLADFTRDHQALQTVLHTSKIVCFGKTDILTALKFARKHGADKWRQNTACIAFIITDACVFDALPEESVFREELEKILPFANSAARLHFVLLGNSKQCFTPTQSTIWSFILSANGQLANNQPDTLEGCQSISCIESTSCVRDNLDAVLRSGSLDILAPTTAGLACGSLRADVTVSPRIITSLAANFCPSTNAMPQLYSTMQIIGFIRPAVVESTPVFSRHLLLPQLPANGDVDMGRRQANLCVLLHGAIRVQPMVAVCLIGPEWYGLIVPVEAGQSQTATQQASSKRSNLSLNVLYPGVCSIPWLGDLSQLVHQPYTGVPPKHDHLAPPPAQMVKCSYAMSQRTNWADVSNFASDVTKLLRFANKLPNKVNSFYLELNRLVRHASAIGMSAFPEYLANELDEEAKMTTNNDVKKHFHYACAQLRQRSAVSAKYDDAIPQAPADYEIPDTQS